MSTELNWACCRDNLSKSLAQPRDRAAEGWLEPALPTCSTWNKGANPSVLQTGHCKAQGPRALALNLMDCRHSTAGRSASRKSPAPVLCLPVAPIRD